MADGPAYVLVVDDDPINRALLAKSLEREGHEHAMAEHGREALEKLRAEAFDIVLLDVVMPELDGYEVLRRIEDDPDLRHVPVIMISAVEDLDSVVRCIELGADDYLPKPFDPVLLRARINGCLMKKRLHDLERERVRDVFSRFVPEPVVDEVLRRTDDDLRLRGVRVNGTVLFSDLRGFTPFAETIPADEVLEVLNDYLSHMSDAILDCGGTLVAYQGDGIMAVFGAPIEADDHADRALAAARDMLGVRLPRFNRNLRENGLGDGFRMGIGLNSGPLMSGTVGSRRRLEYTAIGDTTNTASRLQAMTKGTAHSLLMAESTRELLRRPADDLVFVDERDVPGRRARIRLWTLESMSGVREEVGFATAGAATAPQRTSSD
ncbi:MAG: response regulator [Actinomycetota bacterium]|nr:response regulator [Actinomycetota bacterium]